MIDKIVTVLACLSFAYTDVISTQYSSPTAGFYSSIDNRPGTRRAYPTTPAPIYEDNMEGLPIQSTSQQSQFFHVLNTPYPSESRSDRIVNTGTRTPYLSQAIQNRVLFQPAYNPPQAINTNTGPMTFTTHTHSRPLVNSYSGPVVATTYGHPAFSLHSPATISYSESPVTSHSIYYGGQGSSFSRYY
ncbi:uncharacterized protein LOC123870489 [Maniola jurtina]|uniref:uncharacterized protein LOC123870489 n=1 Tax=Maniola jurtina TaxID=191418 RepID=UPI001E688ACE|nr:uncharacterized protein LOC123870489 [Maniola jurtina]